ncbi:hypothetical protein [Halohasta litorea]|uniref:CRISPR system Cms protein Csm4 n=1 Tax=Halohasta litorea TaxID=869891 RepID=A0ABD6D6V9_9EURY|nr:hypothetical protein [Halohasta litorea]
MTLIQEVLFELETDYFGHPYYVSGHALFTALARRLDDDAGRSLCVSNGVFLPGEYGRIVGTGSSFYTTGLEPVETYDDLFRFRDAAQRWLLDSRPRDAHNTLDLQSHGDRLTFSPTCRFGKPAENQYSKRSVTWHVHCYIHGEGDGVVPLSESVLDGLRVGGARNHGLGEVRLTDSQTIELESLDYSRVRNWDEDRFHIELLSPYVLRSQHPGAGDQSVPWWWDCPHELRRRRERLVVGDDVFDVDTVDHGQRVMFAGDDPVSTAVNGVRRVGTHSKFGFGEFRVRPAGDDRVTWSDEGSSAHRTRSRRSEEAEL